MAPLTTAALDKAVMMGKPRHDKKAASLKKPKITIN
jgi:hypothetical protein